VISAALEEEDPGPMPGISTTSEEEDPGSIPRICNHSMIVKGASKKTIERDRKKCGGVDCQVIWPHFYRIYSTLAHPNLYFFFSS
jgi:hypothetical protein